MIYLKENTQGAFIKDNFNPPKEEMFKDLYVFDEVTEFEHLSVLESRDNKCPFCNKKMLYYYNDKHEMFIQICKNTKCRFFRAYRPFDSFDININLDMVILPGYEDQ